MTRIGACGVHRHQERTFFFFTIILLKGHSIERTPNDIAIHIDQLISQLSTLISQLLAVNVSQQREPQLAHV